MVVKFTGRPKGAMNKASGQLRKEVCHIRCSEGFNQVLDLLKTDEISKADILHDALQQFAFKQPATKKLKYWITKI